MENVVQNVVHARLPAEVIERLDERAVQELRSRSNLAAFLIVQGLAPVEEVEPVGSED